MKGERHYIAAHNGLRGLAALLVVFYHLQFGAEHRLGIETATHFFKKSYLMVDLFFVLSGFIISFTAMPDDRRMMSFECFKFFRSRFARIYPLHLFCLLYLTAFFGFLAVFAKLQGEAADHMRWSATGLLSFLRELFLIHAWGAPHSPTWNIPSWSISAEFLAYLCFPVLVAMLLNKWIELALMVLAVSFFVYIGVTTGDLDIVSVLSGLRCLSGFVLGVLIFKYRRLTGHFSSKALSTVQIVAAAGIMVVLATASNDVYAIPFFALLVAATWSDQGLIARPLASRPLQFLGKISYSVYLNHYALIQILFFFWSRLVGNYIIFEPWFTRLLWVSLVTLVVLVVSSCTLRWIEQPLQRLVLRRTQRFVPAISQREN